MTTTLSNSELLDDSVANSSSLKSKRINRTATTASNPNPSVQEQEELGQEQEESAGEQTSTYEQTQRRNDFSANKSNSKKSVDSDADEKKILGMKPALFYTLLGVAVLVGGVIVYNKYIKKGKGKGKLSNAADAGAGATASASTGSASSASAAPEVKLT